MSRKKKKLADYGNVFNELTIEDVEQREEQRKEKEKEKITEEVSNSDYDYIDELENTKPVYRNHTFEFEVTLLERLDELAKRYGHGFKKKFANEAFRRELDRIENRIKRKKHRS